jgi:hypothetical protein
MKHGIRSGRQWQARGRVRVLPGGCALAVFVTAILASGLPSTAAEAPPSAWAGPGEDLARWLDERFARIWDEEGATAAACDDATFARRVYLDLIGRIPSVSEVRDFLADDSADKHARLVDQLLLGREESGRNTEPHAEHFARVWRRIMIPPVRTPARW